MNRVPLSRLFALCLFVGFGTGCGDKDEEERAGAGSLLDLCGQHCQYVYETAECDEDGLDLYLDNCQRECSSFDLTLSDACKNKRVAFYECALANEIVYQCIADDTDDTASAGQQADPITVAFGCEAEHAESSCLDVVDG